MNKLRLDYIRYFVYALTFSIVLNLSNMVSEIKSYLQIDIIFIILIYIIIGMIYSVNKKRLCIQRGIVIYMAFTCFYILIGLINSKLDIVIPYILSMNINLSIVYILCVVIDKRFKLNELLIVIKYAGLILGILGILEFLNIFSLPNLVGLIGINSGNRIGSTWINPNMYGLALVFSYICSLNSNINTREIVIKFIIFIGIVISMSRSALIMVLICNSIYILISKHLEINIKKIIIVLTTLTIIYTATNYIVNNVEYISDVISNSRFDRLDFFENNDSSYDITNGREDALKSAIYIGIKNPIIGVGIKQIPEYSSNGQSAHNMYINILGESGIIPALLYMIMIIYIVIKSMKIEKKSKNRPISITLSMFIILYGFFSHTLVTNAILGLCIGIILVCIRIEKNYMLKDKSMV